MATLKRNRYVYGPVQSWRGGTSLGIDPIGDISTCSFNCVYCQLGKIQNITSVVKTYVPTEYILEDLMVMEREGIFTFASTTSRAPKIDVITFAGSGEPTLAENLGEIIDSIRDLTEGVYGIKVPISILTNATLLGDALVRKRASRADRLSLKLDAVDDTTLQAINQPAPGVTMASICAGIKKFQQEYGAKTDLQLQIMFMPKYAGDDSFITKLAALIADLGVTKIQINTPTRPKPKSKQYIIETRGNHYHDSSNAEFAGEVVEYTELPVISQEQAFKLEDRLRELLAERGMSKVEIVNVYKR